MKNNYYHKMDHLLNLRPYTLVATGRTGTDFLQSLLDSHHHVLTFNGPLISYYDFWKNSIVASSKTPCPDDLINEFIGHHIKFFKSIYDLGERKNELGPDGDKFVNINLHQFREVAHNLLIDRVFNKKNILLAIYGAYAECLNQDIFQKRIFFHHIHHSHKLKDLLKDFPSTKIISMTRDPRANYYSGIAHRIKFYNSHIEYKKVMKLSFIYTYTKRLFIDADNLDLLGLDYIVIRIEDLGREDILVNLCNWLEIEFENSIKKSTWGGLLWRGDRLSSKCNNTSGWSKEMLQNNWELKLGKVEKYLFNVLLNSRLKYYMYDHTPIKKIDIVISIVLILLPLKFELNNFNPFKSGRISILKGFFLIYENLFSYIKRVLLFYRYLFKEANRKEYKVNLLDSK
jgi:hypothetical protein